MFKNALQKLNQRRINNAKERNKPRDLQGNELINGKNSQLLKLSPDAQKRFSDAMKNSYEPEGDVISEKPGDGYLGPTTGKLGIPNPIRMAKDAVDSYNRANLKKVNTVNKISPGSASMPKFKQFNKDTSAAYKNLFQSHEPQGEVIHEMPKDIQNTLKGGLSSARDQFLDKGKVDVKGTLKKTLGNVLQTKTVNDFLNKNSYEPQGEMIEAKVDKMLPDHKRSGKRLERYGNPHGSLALGGGIQRDRRADHAERRGKKTKGVKEGVKYYSGQDRNPNTGIPKGIKSSGKSTEEKPMKGVPYKDLQASYKPRFSVFDEAADRKMARATDQQLADAHKKYSGMDQSSPANAHMTKRITREINRRKKVSKKKVDEAVGVSSEVSMSRARKEAELQRKEAQLKRKKGVKEHHQKDSNGKVIEHGGGSPRPLDELNRYEKEKGTDTKTGKPITKGGTAKNDKAFQFVAKKYASQRMGGNEPKKVKGAKSDVGTGRITRMLAKKKDQQAKKKALDAKAKAAGYKSTQDYVNVQAVRKGGLGT